ncbi:MAG: shikimate dehydrogenase [Pelagibacteraceae bacterium TMED287]|mgnify:CR=1 FL=1|nr:MAG: shikimate dehydrogenase [Pelagibacteraceae bacterium TMED287]
MKKYLVIGNPIEHSLSPLIHSHWMKKYRFLDCSYEKKKVEKKDLAKIVKQVRSGEISGVNVTVPFKKEIIELLDQVKGNAQTAQSVNTLVKEGNKVCGYNTDVEGFRDSLSDDYVGFKDKKIFILGAGGVASSILEAFVDTVNKIYISNRTIKKAKELKKIGDLSLDLLQKNKNIIQVIDWGKMPEICDIVVNTTSVGLTKDENLTLDFSEYEKRKKVLFYDLIYNPKETNFLKDARLRGNKTMNGKMMFLYQAMYSFQKWTGVTPEIDDETIKLLDNA